MAGTKVFTYEELRKYDGKGPDGKIYVALCGKVFDVTEKGKEFYGEGKCTNRRVMGNGDNCECNAGYGCRINVFMYCRLLTILILDIISPVGENAHF